MPAAKRSTRSPSRSSTFKEPAAYKRLTKSLDTAQEALSELSKQSSREVGQSANAIYKDLRTFVSSARRHTGRLGKALARDFEQAQKKMAKSATTSSAQRTSTRSSSARRGTSRSTSARSSSTSPAKKSSTASKRGTRAAK